MEFKTHSEFQLQVELINPLNTSPWNNSPFLPLSVPLSFLFSLFLFHYLPVNHVFLFMWCLFICIDSISISITMSIADAASNAKRPPFVGISSDICCLLVFCVIKTQQNRAVNVSFVGAHQNTRRYVLRYHRPQFIDIQCGLRCGVTVV